MESIQNILFSTIFFKLRTWACSYTFVLVYRARAFQPLIDFYYHFYFIYFFFFQQVCFEPLGLWNVRSIKKALHLNRYTKASMKDLNSKHLLGISIGLKLDGSLYAVHLAIGTPGAMYSNVYYRRFRGRSFHEDYLTYWLLPYSTGNISITSAIYRGKGFHKDYWMRNLPDIVPESSFTVLHWRWI